jgi:hypothetical protein
LTPEQQRQLAAIDSMPLTMEMELSPEEWASKTQEEKDHIIGEFCGGACQNQVIFCPFVHSMFPSFLSSN